jgi:hypothetical protein
MYTSHWSENSADIAKNPLLRNRLDKHIRFRGAWASASSFASTALDNLPAARTQRKGSIDLKAVRRALRIIPVDYLFIAVLAAINFYDSKLQSADRPHLYKSMAAAAASMTFLEGESSALPRDVVEDVRRKFGTKRGQHCRS